MASEQITELATELRRMPRPAAIRHLNYHLSHDPKTKPGSPANVLEMEWSAKLVTEIREQCERAKAPPPWS